MARPAGRPRAGDTGGSRGGKGKLPLAAVCALASARRCFVTTGAVPVPLASPSNSSQIGASLPPGLSTDRQQPRGEIGATDSEANLAIRPGPDGGEDGNGSAGEFKRIGFWKVQAAGGCGQRQGKYGHGSHGKGAIECTLFSNKSSKTRDL